MTAPDFEAHMGHPAEVAWAEFAARLRLSLFALNAVTFEPDERAGGEVRARCACRAGFDCTAIGKHPKYKRYRDSGTTGEREARLLVTADWRNGFGVLTGSPSGVVVVDVDPKGDDASVAAAVEALHPLPPTLRVLSGREGGYHLYFRVPPGRVAVSDSAGKVVGKGVDIKGQGQMVVWPPSLHRSGRRYRLDPTSPVEIAALPHHLVDLLTKPAFAAPAPRPEVALTALTAGDPQRYAEETFRRTVERVSTQRSERNNTLNTSAFALGQIVGLGLLDLDEVARALIGAAMRSDLSFAEARKTVFSGLYAGAVMVSDSAAEQVARLREVTR